MQALYQFLITGTQSDALLEEFRSRPEFARVDQDHFTRLVERSLTESETLDDAIRDVSDREPDSLDPVERAILWAAVTELRDCRDVPRNVVLNEAVTLAKYFGAADSHRFVNAVLDRIATRERGDAA